MFLWLIFEALRFVHAWIAAELQVKEGCLRDMCDIAIKLAQPKQTGALWGYSLLDNNVKEVCNLGSGDSGNIECSDVSNERCV